MPDSLERVKRITEWVVSKESAGGRPYALFQSPRIPELPARIDLSHDLLTWTNIAILRNIDPDPESRVMLELTGGSFGWSWAGHPDTPTPPRQPTHLGEVVAFTTNPGTTITLRITTNKATFIRLLTVTNAANWPPRIPFPNKD